MPAGTYAVDTEEEGVEGNEHTIYRRVATTLLVETPGRIEHRLVDPQALDAAVESDLKVVLPPAPEPVVQAPITRKHSFLPNWFRALWRGSKD